MKTMTKRIYRGEGANRVRFVPETVDHGLVVDLLARAKVALADFRRAEAGRRRAARERGRSADEMLRHLLAESSYFGRAEQCADLVVILERILKEGTKGHWVRAPKRGRRKR